MNIVIYSRLLGHAMIAHTSAEMHKKTFNTAELRLKFIPIHCIHAD